MWIHRKIRPKITKFFHQVAQISLEVVNYNGYGTEILVSRDFKFNATLYFSMFQTLKSGRYKLDIRVQIDWVTGVLKYGFLKKSFNSEWTFVSWPWSSPSVITFFPILEFSYKLIRFLLHSAIVKSDNDIGKFSY